MNAFGKNFRVSVFGESHGAGIGVVIDGVPAGIDLLPEDFIPDLLRRKSGAKGTTPRKDEDMPELLSGVMAGHTTGAPLAILFRNGNTRPSDYSLFKEMPRPGHADFVAGVKWHDFNDPRGGGHFSGRVTLAIVAAGVVARKLLHSDYAVEWLSGHGMEMLQADPSMLFSVSASLVEVGGIPLSEVERPGVTDPDCRGEGCGRLRRRGHRVPCFRCREGSRRTVFRLRGVHDIPYGILDSGSQGNRVR